MSRMLNLPGSWGSEVGPQPWIHRLGLPVAVHPGFVATGIEGAVTHTQLRKHLMLRENCSLSTPVADGGTP